MKKNIIPIACNLDHTVFSSIFYVVPTRNLASLLLNVLNQWTVFDDSLCIHVRFLHELTRLFLVHVMWMFRGGNPAWFVNIKWERMNDDSSCELPVPFYSALPSWNLLRDRIQCFKKKVHRRRDAGPTSLQCSSKPSHARIRQPPGFASMRLVHDRVQNSYDY